MNLYSLVVWSFCLKCEIRRSVISELQPNGKIKNILLFSTDINLHPEQVIEYDNARFYIEFILRDSKQFTGLFDCKCRIRKRLDFHFTSCLIALNLAKYEAYNRHKTPD